MRYGGPVIQNGLPPPGVEIGLDGRQPGFELQRGRDPVVGLVLIGCVIDAVGVQVDKPWGDDVPLGVNQAARSQRSHGNGRDLAPLDADMADGVQSGCGVDHAAVVDRQVIGRRLRLLEGNGEEEHEGEAKHSAEYTKWPDREAKLPDLRPLR